MARPGSARPFDGVLDMVTEEVAVAQPGQSIVQCLVSKGLFDTLAVGNVLGGAVEDGRGSHLVPDCPRLREQPAQLTVPAQGAKLEAHRLPSFEEAADVVLHQPTVIGVHVGKEALGGRLEGPGFEPMEAVEALRPRDPTRRQLQAPAAQAGERLGLLEAGLRIPEGLLGLGALGHVADGEHDAAHFGHVEEVAQLDLAVAPGSVPVFNSTPERRPGPDSVEHLRPCRSDGWPIVEVHDIEEASTEKIVGVVAEDPGQRGTLVGGNPGPVKDGDAIRGVPDQSPEPLLAGPQRLLLGLRPTGRHPNPTDEGRAPCAETGHRARSGPTAAASKATNRRCLGCMGNSSLRPRPDGEARPARSDIRLFGAGRVPASRAGGWGPPRLPGGPRGGGSPRVGPKRVPSPVQSMRRLRSARATAWARSEAPSFSKS